MDAEPRRLVAAVAPAPPLRASNRGSRQESLQEAPPAPAPPWALCRPPSSRRRSFPRSAEWWNRAHLDARQRRFLVASLPCSSRRRPQRRRVGLRDHVVAGTVDPDDDHDVLDVVLGRVGNRGRGLLRCRLERRHNARTRRLRARFPVRPARLCIGDGGLRSAGSGRLNRACGGRGHVWKPSGRVEIGDLTRPQRHFRSRRVQAPRLPRERRLRGLAGCACEYDVPNGSYR